MLIKGVFSIFGCGIVTIDRIKRNIIKVGEKVKLVGFGFSRLFKSTITDVEIFKKILNKRQAGNNIILLLYSI